LKRKRKVGGGATACPRTDKIEPKLGRGKRRKWKVFIKTDWLVGGKGSANAVEDGDPLNQGWSARERKFRRSLNGPQKKWGVPPKNRGNAGQRVIP